MGGSQLSQLKSTLRDSGLSRTSRPKDPKKRIKQKKQLSSTSQAFRSTKLEAIGNEFNKFDTREENKKFQVVTRQGRLEEGQKGAPGKSRQAGLEQRKKILLPQLEARNHTSTFLDRRFGENSTSLTPEEKALERFTAERTSRLGSKKGRFNLEDGDGDEDEGGELTHGGRKLGFGDEDELEAGGWGGLGDNAANGATDSNRQPLLRRRMAAEAEAEEQPTRKRTKAEIMEEVVAKSKAYKYERQKTKSADDDVRMALDAELSELRMMLGGGVQTSRPPVASTSSTKSKAGTKEPDEEGDDDEDSFEGDEEDSDEDGSDGSEGMNDEELEAALNSAGKSGVDRELLRKLIGGGGDSDSEADDDKFQPEPFDNDSTERPPPAEAAAKDHDPYDSYVRLLALEPRAHASDRLKTPLELAKEAAEELKEREESRLRRQRGEADEDDVEAGGKNKKQQTRKPEGDDLEDDFDMEDEGSEQEEEEGLGKGLEGGFGNQIIEDQSEEEEDEEEDEGDEDENEDDDEDGDVNDIDLEDSDDEEVEDQSAPEALVSSVVEEPVKSRTWGGKNVKPELPFTFPCPSTHVEFARLLNKSGIAEADTATVVKRIRVLYHPGLGEDNKFKLQTFTNVLLDHVLHLASSPSPTTFATINSLLPQLLTLSFAYPLTTAPYYVDKLALMQKNFVRGVSRGALDPESKTWPGPVELTLLRLVGIVWSTSDLSHPVAAAAMLLIGQYLSQSRVRSLGDIASGLFLCTLVGQYESFSKRLVPEVANFLLNAFAILVPTSITTKNFPGSCPSPDLGQEHVKSLRLRSTEALDSRPLNFIASLAGGSSDKQLKVDLIAANLALLKDLGEKYVSLDAFIELFRPVEAILAAVSLNHVPVSIQTKIAALQSDIKRMLKLSISSRKPLLLQHHKPIPIPTFIPKFDEGYNPNRKFDPDTDRAEASKLKSLYKKEKKGAIRELRKDNKFLASENQKLKAVKDAEYTKKIAKIMGSLQDERAEEKVFNKAREKGKRQDKARKGGKK